MMLFPGDPWRQGFGVEVGGSRSDILTSSGTNFGWGDVGRFGLDTVSDLIRAKLGGGQPGGVSQFFGDDFGVAPIGGGLQNIGMAAIGPAILQAGGRIVGTVIQITKAGWNSVPSLIKQAALALGLTVALTDIGVADITGAFGGNGDAGLTDAQEKRLGKFRRYISAGMTPKQAARSAGLDRRPRRGITHAQLRGFSKVSGMLAKWGMVPRKLRGAKRRKVCK